MWAFKSSACSAGPAMKDSMRGVDNDTRTGTLSNDYLDAESGFDKVTGGDCTDAWRIDTSHRFATTAIDLVT